MVFTPYRLYHKPPRSGGFFFGYSFALEKFGWPSLPDSTIQLPDYNWDISAYYTMYPVALGSTHACMYVHMYTVHIDKTILCMPDP